VNRQRSTSEPRSRAKDSDDGSPESDRLARVEAAILDIRTTLDVQFKRIAAVQAQLDHLAAKISGR
jgi:hypothetical protein